MRAATTSVSAPPASRHKTAGYLFVCLFLLITAADISRPAQVSAQDFRIRQRDGRFSISATDASLNNVLLNLADTAGITVRMSKAVDRRVTIEQAGLSLKALLERLLKGLNHVIIYSGKSRQEATIAKVLVLSRARPKAPLSAAGKRLSSRIKSYERQVDSLKRALARHDASSRQGKRYLQRIKALERSIRRLQQQAY